MRKRQADGKEATMVRIEIARWERDKQMGRKLLVRKETQPDEKETTRWEGSYHG